MNGGNDFPTVELRLAVTMNGGASLAVYMGGVAHELQRFTHPDSHCAELISRLAYTPVIDVITGTSAGGINGAALALAQANKNADMAALRGLWIEHGGMEALLRQPFQKSPPSLLKGDEYFLPQVQRALRGLVTPFDRSDRSVDLTITTTLLRSANELTTDCFGTRLVQPDHAGLFHFLGTPETGTPDQFGDPAIHEAIALAARASAAFPVAFEPTFIPVGCPDPTSRPDMKDYADWAREGTDRSRFGVDGGVLANTPTKPALEAIQRQEVQTRFVKRILLLVHPHAVDASTVTDRPDRHADPPTLVGGLAQVLGAATSVGSRTYVEEIARHNAVARRWRNGRVTTMGRMPDWSSLRGFLALEQVWSLIGALLENRIAVDLAEQVGESVTRPADQLYAAARAAISAKGGCVPDGPPSPQTVPADGWRWGFPLASGVISLTTQLLTELQCNIRSLPADRRAAVASATKAAYLLAVNNGIALAELIDRNRAEVAAAPETISTAALFDDLLGVMDTPTVSAAPSVLTGHRVRELAGKVAGALGDVVAAIGEFTAPGTVTLLEPNPFRAANGAGTPDGDALLIRLLSVELVSYLVSEQGPTDPTVPATPIDLIQLSAQVQQHFARGFTSDDKLAGMALNRFSAFLKRSWRANDWIWGRLDAVKILMLIMLNPQRVAALLRARQSLGTGNNPAAAVVRDIGSLVYGSKEFQAMTTPCAHGRGPLQDLYEAAVAEVERSGAGGESMESLASLAAYGVQIRIAAEEVPWLVAAIQDDRDDGASGGVTQAFLRRIDTIRADHHADSPAAQLELLRAFAKSGIGGEDLGEQIPSDLMIRTGATAAATAVTMAASPRSGVGLAQPVTRILRGLVAVPYWVVSGLTHSGAIARAVTATVLALGVSFVALSLLAPLPGIVAGLTVTLGIGSLIAVVAYSTMRTRSVVHAAAFLGLFLFLIPFLGYRLSDARPAPTGSAADHGLSASGGTAVGATLFLVLATVVIANINSPVRSPLSAADVMIRRLWAWVTRRWLRILSVTVVVVAAGVLVWLLRPWWTRAFGADSIWFTWDAWNSPWTWLTGVLIVALIAHALAVGYFSSRALRPHPIPGTAGGPARPQRLTDSAGLATAWSSAYGAAYMILGCAAALLIGHRIDEPAAWVWTAPILAFLLGVLFGVVAVHLIPAQRERRMIARLASDPKVIRTAENPTSTITFDDAVLDVLERTGEHAAYLTEYDGAHYRLAPGGQRVARRIRSAVAARG